MAIPLPLLLVLNRIQITKVILQYWGVERNGLRFIFLYEVYELLSKYGNKGFNGFLYRCSRKQRRHFTGNKMSFTSIRAVIVTFTITLNV